MTGVGPASAPGRSGGEPVRLRPCPGPPNCVCSEDPRPEFFVEPFPFQGDPNAAWQRLIDLLRRQPRVRIVEQSESYLRAEFRTAVLRFVDVVECRPDREQSVIHVRSESRLGYSDLGINRRRIERLRRAWLDPALRNL